MINKIKLTFQFRQTREIYAICTLHATATNHKARSHALIGERLMAYLNL